MECIINEELKILIISLSGMGDVLLFTPALHLLRQQAPRSHISVLVKYKASAQVLTGNPDVDQVEVFDPKSNNILENIRFYYNQRKIRYDMSISTFPALTALNNLSTWVIGAGKRWTYNPGHFFALAFLQNHTIPYYHGRHRIYYNLELVKTAIKNLHEREEDSDSSLYPAENDLSFKPEIENNIRLLYYISEEEKCFARRFLNDHERLLARRSDQTGKGQKNIFYIGIHPGSGADQPFKRWPVEKFSDLVSQLQIKFGAHIILFGGKEEIKITENIAYHIPVPPIIATGKTNIRETAALIQCCHRFISNDSGLMHLAVAVGTPVIGIFGPTDEISTAPIGKEDKVVLLDNLLCKPDCRKRYLFNKHCNYGFRCLKELEIKQVMEAISFM